MTATVAHPAKFTNVIVDRMREVAERYLPHGARILDPFAGVGTIHQLRPEYETWGVELEHEWAFQSEFTVDGDSRCLANLWRFTRFDAVMTSPCYGNRMADHHEAKDASRRHTYRHTLGRALTPGNAGAMQWGEPYRQLHRDVYASCLKVLRVDNPTLRPLFVLNMSNHIRKGEVIDVTSWHVASLAAIGFTEIERHEITTPRQKHGANAHLRVENESLIVMRYAR